MYKSVIANEGKSAAFVNKMKMLFRSVVAALLALFSAVIAADEIRPRSKMQSAMPRIVANIQETVDSALLMADDYATALAQKPEFAGSRLNVLKKYYNSISTDAARDSVRSRIFDFYVSYVENGKTQQAEAFKQCFMAIAPDTDEHFGPLYANELTLARERFDTAAVKTGIDRLAAYAARMNYDYDDDLAVARRFLHNIRTRKPVEDILPGIWVCEDIWKDRVLDYEYKDMYLKAILFHPAAIANSLSILKIPRGKNIDGELVAQKCKGLALNVTGSEMFGMVLKMAGIGGFIPVKQADLTDYNIGQSIGSDAISTTNTAGFDPHVYSKNVRIDNDAYGAYIFWGDEKLRRPNAEIAAFVRQSVQNSRALIAGQLSRSQYSFGEEMVGNFFAGLASEAINAVVDYFMVSTDRIFSVETVLQVINPCELKAKTYLQIVISKSNEPSPHKFSFVFESTYYRWDSPEDIVFMGPYKVKDAEASALNYGGLLTLSDLPKEKRKAKENEIKEYCKRWKEMYKEEVKTLKASVNAMPKGAEKDLAKKQMKNYKKTRQQCWGDYNKQMYLRLKSKSDNYMQ